MYISGRYVDHLTRSSIWSLLLWLYSRYITIFPVARSCVDATYCANTAKINALVHFRDIKVNAKMICSNTGS